MIQCPHSRTIFCLLLVRGACIPVLADTIFFTSGVEYARNLDLSYAGSPGSPLVITSSGPEKAIIDAGNGHGLTLDHCRNITIRNLEFRGAGRLTGNVSDGIIIDGCEEVVIEDLEVHGFQHSGLLVTGESSAITIQGVHAHDNGFAGIHVFGPWPAKNLCKNILLSHCRAVNNPGDPTILNNHSGNGILVGACDSVVIEYCEATGNGWDMPRKGNGPVGIWAWHADHVTIQHCISHHNRTSPGAADGGGFDLDGGMSNSVIQYCLSYENEGAGIGLFQYTGADPWHDNLIRYNVSINDGTMNGNAAVAVWNGNPDKGLLARATIHNNVFFNDRSHGHAVWYIDGLHEDLRFANNFFLTLGPALQGTTENSIFLGNVYWNMGNIFTLAGYTSLNEWAQATGQEMLGDSVAGMNLAPMLVNPGVVSVTDPDSLGPGSLGGYMLQPGSPVIDRGVDLFELFGIDPGKRDLFGNEIPAGRAFDPGVHEYGSGPGSSTGLKEPGLWVGILPNPVKPGEINIRLEGFAGIRSLTIHLSDIHGRVLLSRQIPNPGREIRLTTRGILEEGNLYVLTVIAGNRRMAIKVLTE